MDLRFGARSDFLDGRSRSPQRHALVPWKDSRLPSVANCSVRAKSQRIGEQPSRARAQRSYADDEAAELDAGHAAQAIVGPSVGANAIMMIQISLNRRTLWAIVIAGLCFYVAPASAWADQSTFNTQSALHPA